MKTFHMELYFNSKNETIINDCVFAIRRIPDIPNFDLAIEKPRTGVIMSTPEARGTNSVAVLTFHSEADRNKFARNPEAHKVYISFSRKVDV